MKIVRSSIYIDKLFISILGLKSLAYRKSINEKSRRLK